DNGGKVEDNGPPKQIMDNQDSLTGDYLTGRQFIPVPAERRKKTKKAVRVAGAEANNLKEVTADFPIGLFTVVTGVSGSGKSTLVNEILYKSLAKHLYRGKSRPGAH